MNFQLFCEMYKNDHNLNHKYLTIEQLMTRWKNDRIILKDVNITYDELLNKIEIFTHSIKSDASNESKTTNQDEA